jgi:predicted TIM-barrel fold metal-dependent hydrolase
MLELEHGFRVVDVHARLEPDAARRGGEEPGTPERLEREMHQAGIVRSLVASGPREGSYLKVNNGVARMSVGRPLVAAARVTGARDPANTPTAKLRNLTASRADEHTSPEDISQYAFDDRFVAFVLHPVRDGLPDEEVLGALERASLPVLVHGGQGFPPEAVAETLLPYDVPIVLAHFGGHPLQQDMMERAVDMLGRHDRLYLDTSFAAFRDTLERAIMEHPDRVLFGSGAPAIHPNVAIMEILTLDVPEDAMRRAFSHNAARVIDALAPASES